MPKTIEVGGKTYYSLSEAARLVGVSHVMMFKWAAGKVLLRDLEIEVLTDPINRRRFVSKESCEKLAQRFREVQKGRKRSRIVVDGVEYYSLPEAAKLIGVPKSTFYDWANGRVPLNGFAFQTSPDPYTGQRRVSEETVRKLANRYRPAKKLTAKKTSKH